MATQGRRHFSPNMRPRPVRHEAFIRERNSYPSPPKKPRVDYGPYPEPERRPVTKPVQRIPGPRAANPVVIEKKPVLFNAGPKDVSEYPPLPQRIKPVQKQQPKPLPQRQPVKTIEMQEQMRPIQKQPVKTVEKQEPNKLVQKQPIKTFEKQEPVKPIQKQPVKTVEKQEVVNPIQKQPVKTVEKQEPMKPIQKQPVKTVEKQEPINPIQKQPVKTAEQQAPNKPTQKEPIKTVEKPEQIKPALKQPAKPDIQNQESPKATEKKEADPVKNSNKAPQSAAFVEPTAEASELDMLLSRALKDELQLITDQVSQMLPSTAQLRSERFVLDKFKTVVADDIKNALGLNVTSRLLNVHNPLYVKLLFSGKPEAGCLQAFINKYNISAFKRIESPHDTFAARLDVISDFDRLCEAKEVSCGSAKVTVTPCYKFLTCPPALKSIYRIKTENQDTASDSSPQKQSGSVKSENAVAKTADQKATSKDDTQRVTVKKEVESANDDSEKEETKTETRVKNTKTVATTPVKVNITIEGTSKVDNKNSDSKEVKLETKSETPKETVTKSETNNKLEMKKETSCVSANKTNKKVINQSNVVDKSHKEVKNNSNEDMMVEDDEEMTDQDILALMSGGIVLDECSGSDDE